MLKIIDDNDKLKMGNMRNGKGGVGRYVVRIKPDHYDELVSDGNLITDRDKKLNQLNQQKGYAYLIHPTTGELIERIIEIWKRLPAKYKYKGIK